MEQAKIENISLRLWIQSNMDETQKKQFSAAMSAIINSISIVCNNIQNFEKREESIEQLRNNLTELIIEEDRNKRASYALLKIQSNIMDDEDPPKIEDEMNKAMNDISHVKPEKHDYMRAFESKVSKFMWKIVYFKIKWCSNHLSNQF